MQQKNKEQRKQIIKMLNIQNMIDQYLGLSKNKNNKNINRNSNHCQKRNNNRNTQINNNSPFPFSQYYNSKILKNNNKPKSNIFTQRQKYKKSASYTINGHRVLSFKQHQQQQFLFKQNSKQIVKNSSTLDPAAFQSHSARAISLKLMNKKNLTQSNNFNYLNNQKQNNDNSRQSYNRSVKIHSDINSRHKAPVKSHTQRLFLRGDTQQQSILEKDTNNTTIQFKKQKQQYLSKNNETIKIQQEQNDAFTLYNYNQSKISNKQKQSKEKEKKLKSIFQKKFKGFSYKNIKKQQKNQKIIKNRYELQSIIGRGMSGPVYKAKDILSNRYIAIKVVQANAKQYEFIKQLSHKNIIEYYNNFIENGKRYLVLQYFPLTLNTLLKTKKLKKKQIRDIFNEIIDGIIYLHGLSIAHRDIKLDNIVISQDMKIIKFIDFGLCSDINDSQNILNTQMNENQNQTLDRCSSNNHLCKEFCGTPNYMAPQIINNKSYDPKKADIWSLGILLYTLTVGRFPFQGSSQNDTYYKIRNKKVVFPSGFQESLQKLITKMLIKDPNNRPNIIEVIKDNWFNQQD